MTTIHAYTNDQVTLDVAHKKGIASRRGRACAMNIVPSSTGAATAIGKVIPELSGRLSGGAMRVPVSDGSLIDLSLELKRNTTIEEINNLFKKKVNITLHYTDDPIVSSDIISSQELTTFSVETLCFFRISRTNFFNALYPSSFPKL